MGKSYDPKWHPSATAVKYDELAPVVDVNSASTVFSRATSAYIRLIIEATPMLYVFIKISPRKHATSSTPSLFVTSLGWATLAYKLTSSIPCYLGIEYDWSFECPAVPRLLCL
jgi:hypothetical protein